jgi:hypothetical protein
MNKFEELATEVAKLVATKQVAYGDSFGKAGTCLRQMFPNGIKPGQYDDLLTIARIIDKLFRIASNPEAFGENPYKDICGYALLGMNRYNEVKKNDYEEQPSNSRVVGKVRKYIREQLFLSKELAPKTALYTLLEDMKPNSKHSHRIYRNLSPSTKSNYYNDSISVIMSAYKIEIKKLFNYEFPN